MRSEKWVYFDARRPSEGSGRASLRLVATKPFKVYWSLVLVDQYDIDSYIEYPFDLLQKYLKLVNLHGCRTEMMTIPVNNHLCCSTGVEKERSQKRPLKGACFSHAW